MAVADKLGTMTISVEIGPDGQVSASFHTALAPAVAEMQGAMSEQELEIARALQRQVLAAAAEFFAYVRNPDDALEVT